MLAENTATENITDIVESAKAVKQESVNPIDANELPATAAAIAGPTATNTTSPSTAPQTPQIQPIEAPRYNQEILDLSKQIEDSINTSAVAVDKSHLQGLPVRQYLDQTVVPLLVEGLKALVKERPPNPVEYLSLFLLQNQ